MSAQPGSLDFSKLAQEANKALDNPPASESKVKVAASEGGIPAPNNDTAQDTLNKTFDAPEIETPTQELVDSASKTVSHNTEKVTEQIEQKSTTTVDDVLDLPDTAKVKVKIDGEVQTISYGDYKDILRKNATVTQRMQQFAKSRDEFNAEVQRTVQQLEAREAALKSQSEKKDPLYETILSALKGQVEPKPRDPNEIVTLGDVQAERKKLEEEFNSKRENDKKQFEQQLIEAAQSLQTQSARNRERQAYLDEVRKVLHSDEYKPLAEVNENLEASVIFHMQKSGAQNLQEAVEVSLDYLKDRNKAFKKYTIAQQQEQQANAVKQKMESTNGVNPSVAQREKSQQEKARQFVGKNGKLDWNAMAKDSMARMNSMN